ncbi:MAG: hypothetical protein LIR50_02345 [Bacillota bacterium]|nr:hypothetical protein [Bacillota bacterium]
MIIRYLKALSNLSFIFLAVNFIFCLAGYAPVNEYIFVWMIMFNLALYFKKYRNIYIKTLFLIFLILPVIFISSNYEKLIVLIIFAVIFYLYKQKNNLSYGETCEEFKKIFYIILAIFIISAININGALSGRFIIPYMIYYLIFTVLLIRYLRNYEYNAVNEKLNKINFSYFVVIIISALIFALKSVRHSILSIVLIIYGNIMDIFIYIFSLIFLLVYSLFKNIHIKGINPDIFKISPKDSKLQNTAGIKDYGLANPLLHKIIIIFVNTMIILLAVYIIIRLLNKKSTASPNSEKCEETKEFIFSEKHSDKIKSRFVFGDYSSQIKYYYRKLIKDIISKGINLNKSDTTMDIHLKSRGAFDKASLWSMRDMYIKVRYGSRDCTKDNVKEFRNLYKNRKI